MNPEEVYLVSPAGTNEVPFPSDQSSEKFSKKKICKKKFQIFSW